MAVSKRLQGGVELPKTFPQWLKPGSIAVILRHD
jgi:hypothetical protein